MVTKEEILKGWKIAAETWTPSELTIEERHAFEQAILMEKQAKEKSFVLPK